MSQTTVLEVEGLHWAMSMDDMAHDLRNRFFVAAALSVPILLWSPIGRGTLRKMRQNLGWAMGYNAIALPVPAGVFEPAFGFALRPEIAALSMSGSSLIVAVNALMLKRLRLPRLPQHLEQSPRHENRPA